MINTTKMTLTDRDIYQEYFWNYYGTGMYSKLFNAHSKKQKKQKNQFKKKSLIKIYNGQRSWS